MRIGCLRKANNIARVIPLSINIIWHVLKLENHIASVIIIQPRTTSDLGFNQSLSLLTIFIILAAASPCSTTGSTISFTWEHVHTPHHLSTLLFSYLAPSGFSTKRSKCNRTYSVLANVQSEMAAELTIHVVDLRWMKDGNQGNKWFTLYFSLWNVLR